MKWMKPRKRYGLWKDVLILLYERMPYQVRIGDGSFRQIHPLAKELGITENKLEEAFDVLREMGLIRGKIINLEAEYYLLTEEGFKVANNIENTKQALKPQRIIALGTSAMAIGGIATLYVQIIKDFQSTNWFTISVLILLVSIGSFFIGMLLSETFFQKGTKNRRP